jgi:hypothetical protein
MNWIKNIFKKIQENLPYELPVVTKKISRYPENIGDFYVENDSCITCGAPEVEAPDLIIHSTKEYGHCYFKKQPKTEKEIDQAINAIWVSCVGALRYGGTDQQIIKRLYEIGLGDKCDEKPNKHWRILIRNIMKFQFDGNIEDFSSLLTEKFKENSPYGRIIYNNISSNKSEILVRWTDENLGIYFRIEQKNNNNFQLNIDKEPKAYIEAIISFSASVHDWFTENDKVKNILWQESNSTEKVYLKPY